MCTLSGPIVYSWCRRSGLQDSDAADVVQEVFRAVFQHLKEFQARGGVFHAWLDHITANQIRQHFRQHRRLPLVCLGQQAEEIVDPGPPPDWENEWEQAKGEKVDARADLYSLGVVLYRMATGQLPLSAPDTYSMLVMLATEQPRPIQELAPDLPPALADLIMRLLAKDPQQRPSCAREVIHELRTIIETLIVTEQSPPPALSPGQQALAVAQPVSTPQTEPETVNNPWAILTISDTSAPPTAPQTQRRPRRSYPNFTLPVALGIATLATLILIGSSSSSVTRAARKSPGSKSITVTAWRSRMVGGPSKCGRKGNQSHQVPSPATSDRRTRVRREERIPIARLPSG